MKWLNYNHLYYFWMVAREGGVARAAEELLLSQPTVSAQLKRLEASLGQSLFERAGRRLALTDAGRVAFNYANEMFSLGQDLLNELENRSTARRALKVAIGILDVIPKPVARKLLEPAMNLAEPVRLICREDKADRLLADLAARRTDVVLSDSPVSPTAVFHGFNHLLGESGVSFFATRTLAGRYRRGFPKSLDGAPVLLPTDHTALRRSLDLWFDRRRVHPIVVAEFDDSATMFTFGQDGAGIFPAPSVVADRIQREIGVRVVGATNEVRQRFYAISPDEKLKHPAVIAICEAARRELSQG